MPARNMALYMRERRTRRRNELIELRGGKCEECGSVDRLEFNHIDRSTKSFNLSGKWLDTKWSRILEELEKCELLCKTHHQVKTNAQRAGGW